MALAPVALTLSAWALLGQKPSVVLLIGAAVGAMGVPLLVGVGTGGFEPWGLAASLTAMLMNMEIPSITLAVQTEERCSVRTTSVPS